MMYRRSEGLSGSPLTSQIIGAGGAVTGLTVGAIIGGPVGAAVGGAIGIVSSLIGSLFSGGVGGQQKIASTNIVNQVEPLLKQNLAAYLASSRTSADQEAALANFDAAWSGVVQQCGNPQLGQAGVNCIADRERGATSGYDWFALYRDPIADDPNVQPSIAGSLLSAAGGGASLGPLLLFGVLIALAVKS